MLRSGAELDADLSRWVDAGLVTAEQSARIAEFEHGRTVRSEAVPAAVAPLGGRRIPAVAEALGYLGGILAIVGLVLLVARYWPDMATAGRVALSATGALAFLGAGAVVGEEADPALARLRGFLWLASSAAAALFAGVLVADAFGVTKHDTIVLACAGLVALQNGLLWRGHARRPLQQLAFLAGLVVAAGATVGEVAPAGPVGLTVWTVGMIFLAGGLTRRTPLPLLTETVGAIAVFIGSIITASDWQAFGLPFAAASALALLAFAVMPGLASARADQQLAALVGTVALLATGPGAIDYYARDAGAATGMTVWIIGAALLYVGASRRVRLPVVVEAIAGIVILGGAALTGIQWHGFAPIFGVVTALGLVALGMLPGQVLLSVLGSLGLLINVPWTIGWFFPGEGRAPLLILISGALILTIAVLLTHERGRFRNELTTPPRRSPPRHLPAG